ncbi:hypothetical protein ACFTAO_29495 [Paenibacillus rhizoplanae]
MRLNTQLESQSWFTTAKRTSEISYSAPHIQNLFKGRYTWVVSISKLIQYRENGELRTGVLLLDFNFRTIDQLSKQVKLGKKEATPTSSIRSAISSTIPSSSSSMPG